MKFLKTSVVGRATTTVASLMVCGAAGVFACSDLLYTIGRYDQAVKVYPSNTAAKLAQLTKAEDVDEMQAVAESILSEDEHISLAYSALARCAYADGDIETFIKYKLKAIHLAPYQFDEYLDYLNSMYLLFQMYQENGDVESAGICMKRMEKVPDMLKELEQRTSEIAWKIADRPQVTLPHEYTELFEKMRGSLDE